LLAGDDSDAGDVVLSADLVGGRGAVEGCAALTNIDADEVEPWRASTS
jgi:hypothetical protein